MYASLILCIQILHSVVHQPVKFERNQANINIVIGIQSDPSHPSHIYWPLFEDEKKESIALGCAYFHIKSFCVEKFAPKRVCSNTSSPWFVLRGKYMCSCSYEFVTHMHWNSSDS